MPGVGACDQSDLCSELRGDLDTEFTRTYPKLSHRLLSESTQAAALVDLSPMVLGHALVCPRLHYFSAAQSLQDPQCHYLDFLSPFLEQYQQVFGDYVVLEHGSTDSMSGSACISHAHLHVLPLQLDPIVNRMSADGLVLEEVGSWAGLADVGSDNAPYFLAADRESIVVARRAPRMPNQYFRTVIGVELDIPPEECDWAVVIRRHIFEQTLEAWESATG
jgi:diadenosine tetraphosphate (Ap4A) HIT family hydrolase